MATFVSVNSSKLNCLVIFGNELLQSTILLTHWMLSIILYWRALPNTKLMSIFICIALVFHRDRGLNIVRSNASCYKVEVHGMLGVLDFEDFKNWNNHLNPWIFCVCYEHNWIVYKLYSYNRFLLNNDKTRNIIFSEKKIDIS